ncbi:MAG: YdbH domain-containing protein, partial [Sphingomonas sp.]
AREVVLTIELGARGPYVKRVEADGVRLRGRIVDGRLRLGAVDRLLPAPSGAPFALPDVAVGLRDAVVDLATPAGAVVLRVDGSGRLTDGFTGRVTASAPRLAAGGCRIEAPSVQLNVSITQRAPALDGPVRAASVACAGVTVTRPALALDTMLSPTLDQWNGGLIADLGGVRTAGAALGRTSGRIGFVGTARRTTGLVQLTGEAAGAGGLRAGAVALDGRYLLLPEARAGRYEGRAAVTRLAIDDARLEAVRRIGRTGGGTPAGPILAALAGAVGAAARGVDARADLAVQVRGSHGAMRLHRVDAASASGAHARVAGVIDYAWPSGARRVAARVGVSGGGLPATTLTLRQPDAAAPLTGLARMAPFAAGGARLALAPVRFGTGRQGTRLTTTMTLDGPVADGRVTGLTLPVTARVSAEGMLTVNEGCVPLRFATLSIAGARIGAARLPLCPAGRALVLRAPGAALRSGGAIAAPRLAGTLGGQPLAIAARRLRFDVNRTDFVADALAVRLGAEAVTRLDADTLTGTFGRHGITGRFAGLGGQIARVPLIVSAGAGDWHLAGGVLDMAGGLRVADEAAAPRFQPLLSDDFHLRLAGGRITAGGWLKAPASGVKVTQVAIRHDLGSGTGAASLDVPGITFTESLQPEALTRLTLGVVANVRGTLTGRGDIAWGAGGVTSTGTFSTESTDLAAAFGPVKGIRTTVRFTDLLGLVSAPGQVATVAEVNPGIAATAGVIRYRLLADQKVQIEDARWPFSGGELELDPTILDFGANAVRRMTFRARGVDAAEFVEQFDFKNVAVTGTFDGVVPILFDEHGGHIAGGRLAVRRGGGVIAYVGEISNANLGRFGSLAFDALKRMRYRRLVIELDGPLDGELVSRLLFDGTNETPKKAVRSKGLLAPFMNLPFRFRITIRAPFRGLLNSARSLNDPRGLIGQALPDRTTALPGSSPEVSVTTAPASIQSR